MDESKVPNFIARNFALRALYKVFYQTFWLLSVLFTIQRPDYIICQTPPFLPVVPILLFYTLFNRRTKLVIDWHNFGYTLIHEKHSFIRSVYKGCEKYFGYYAHANLCVTKAMQKELKDAWGIKAHVLYDRAPLFFRQTTVEEKHKLFSELSLEPQIQSIQVSKPIIDSSNKKSIKEYTLFTILYKDGTYELRKDRPALLVSSTSWTDDEDFNILLDALIFHDKNIYQSNNNNDNNNISMVVMITGKGPNKAKYEEKINQLNLKHVKIVTLWLTAENYPLLLGSADLGVSLHLSSSGFDLPMKVVDMFGANLPVAAINFSCLNELVNDKNGVVFQTSQQLSKQLGEIFTGFPADVSILKKLSNGTKEFQKVRWEDNWNEVVAPLLI